MKFFPYKWWKPFQEKINAQIRVFCVNFWPTFAHLRELIN